MCESNLKAPALSGTDAAAADSVDGQSDGFPIAAA